MFYEFQIAKAKHAELDAQFDHLQEFEGVRVRVPNILERAVTALRATLARRGAEPQQEPAALHRGTGAAT
jgi:hypothetical protein